MLKIGQMAKEVWPCLVLWMRFARLRALPGSWSRSSRHGLVLEKWGAQPLLLVGFALEIVRAVLFAFSTDYAAADAVIETIGLPSVALRHRERSR